MSMIHRCDICGKEVSDSKSLNLLTIAPKDSSIINMISGSSGKKSGDICLECTTAIEQFIQSRKNKKKGGKTNGI